MSRPWIIRFKMMSTDVEGAVFRNQQGCSFFVSCRADTVGLCCGICFYSLLSVVFKSCSSVAVRMGGYAHHHRLMMLYFYAVQQGLKLCCIPGRIKQYSTFFCQHVHAVRRSKVSFELLIGGVNVKVSGEMRNYKFPMACLSENG